MKLVFASSTFRDFQKERDLIQQVVVPEINAYARQYGENVEVTDLRWGIDTTDYSEDASERKILEVCLSEIERAHPHVIIMIGDVYGYVPNESAIRAEAERKGMTLDEAKISVTELEIRYALWMAKQNYENIFVYKRKSSLSRLTARSDGRYEELSRRDALVEFIRNSLGEKYKDHIKEYDEADTDTFCRIVKQDLISSFEPEWKEDAGLPEFLKEHNIHKKYMREKAHGFSARTRESEYILSRLRLCDERRVVVRGVAGTGKSTLFSHVCECLEAEGCTVIPVFCGYTTGLSSAFGVLRHIVCVTGYLLSHKTIKTESTVSALLHQLNENIREYSMSGKGKLYICIDAVDQLAADSLRNFLAFIPHFPENFEIDGKKISCNVRIFMTVAEDGLTEEADSSIVDKSDDILKLEELTYDDKCKAIDSILKTHGKELGTNIKAKLAEKRSSGNPLYLYFSILYLMLFDSEDYAAIKILGNDMNAISAYIGKKTDELPGDVSGIAVTVVDEIADGIGASFMKYAVRFIAMSHQGLRMEDIAHLCSSFGFDFDRLRFLAFVNYISELFIMRNDGRFDFMHKNLRIGVTNHIKKCNDYNLYSDRIFSYIETLPESDVLKQNEYIYQCLIRRAYENLTDILKQNANEKLLKRNVYEIINSENVGAPVRRIVDGGMYIEIRICSENEHVLKEWGAYLSLNSRDELPYFVEFINSFYMEYEYSGGADKRTADAIKEAYEYVLANSGKVAKDASELLYVSKGYEWLATLHFERYSKDEAARYYEDMIIYLEKAVTVDSESSSGKWLNRRLSSYARIGFFYECLEGEKNAQKCFYYYNKAYELFMGVCQKGNIFLIYEGKSNQHYVGEISMLSNLARGYTKLKGYKNLQKAIGIVDRMVNLLNGTYIDNFFVDGSTDSTFLADTDTSLFQCYGVAANMYRTMYFNSDDDTYKEKADTCYRTAIERGRESVLRFNYFKAKRVLTNIQYNYAAFLYALRDYESALAQITESNELCVMNYKETHAASDEKDMSVGRKLQENIEKSIETGTSYIKFDVVFKDSPSYKMQRGCNLKDNLERSKKSFRIPYLLKSAENTCGEYINIYRELYNDYQTDKYKTEYEKALRYAIGFYEEVKKYDESFLKRHSKQKIREYKDELSAL